MKTLLISIFFLLGFLQLCSAQETQGRLVYSIEALPQDRFEDLKETNPDQYRQFVAVARRFENEVEQLKFILTFKGAESSYRAEDFMTKVGAANSFGNAKGVFYNNQQTGERLQQVERNGRIFVITRDRLSWEITAEVKQIGEFNARKAIAYVESFDGASTNEKEEAIAWFSPDIPVSAGPEGFDGLPGLILELQVAGGRYYVDRMDLSPKNISIERLSTENLVTFEEYRVIMQELNEKYKSFHGL